jgi:KaiC/GvpD/RAD55 family RecA-like ATPase
MSLTSSRSTISVTKDDYDWLLELGRQQGDSRIIGARHPSVQGLITQFRPPMSEGLCLPWFEANEYVRFVPGKVTVWSGPSFSGKTGFLRQLMLHALANQHRVLFISLEEEQLAVWREFICMACVTRTPPAKNVEWCLDLWDGQLFVFDSNEMIEPTLMLGIIRHVVAEYRITHVVIDSLMRMAIRTDDYDGQREFLNMLGHVSEIAAIHTHLVVHPRKTVNSRSPMDLYDIRGAQDIVAQAHLIATLERKYGEEHDGLLTLWKQRGDIDWIGTMKLYYDKPSRQLMYDRFGSPARYLPQQAYA